MGLAKAKGWNSKQLCESELLRNYKCRCDCWKFKSNEALKSQMKIAEKIRGSELKSQNFKRI